MLVSVCLCRIVHCRNVDLNVVNNPVQRVLLVFLKVKFTGSHLPPSSIDDHGLKIVVTDTKKKSYIPAKGLRKIAQPKMKDRNPVAAPQQHR